jgi:predicted acyltransferase
MRSIVLAILGIILWQQPGGAHPHYGFYSVLYRIGVSYLFAAIIMLNTSIKQQVYWAFGLLIGHWLLLRFVPVPGYGIGDFSQEGNLNTYVGNQVANFISPNFSSMLSLSLIPSISNALFGALAGHWLMSEKKPTKKTMGILIAGIIFILVALIVHFYFPINKKLGSPAFTLLTCGISGVLLSAFFWLIDVKGKKKWAFFLVVVGMNPLTIYLANSLVKFNNIANVFVGGFDFGNAQAFVFAVALASIKWLFLYYLYKQKIFLKI